MKTALHQPESTETTAVVPGGLLAALKQHKKGKKKDVKLMEFHTDAAAVSSCTERYCTDLRQKG